MKGNSLFFFPEKEKRKKESTLRCQIAVFIINGGVGKNRKCNKQSFKQDLEQINLLFISW